MSIASSLVAVVYRGRALPVAWRVLHHSSAMVSFKDYRDVLDQAARCLPKDVKIVLLAANRVCP